MKHWNVPFDSQGGEKAAREKLPCSIFSPEKSMDVFPEHSAGVKMYCVFKCSDLCEKNLANWDIHCTEGLLLAV